MNCRLAVTNAVKEAAEIIFRLQPQESNAATGYVGILVCSSAINLGATSLVAVSGH